MEACQKYKHSDVYIVFHNVTATVDLFEILEILPEKCVWHVQ